jgi:hypothetical protein
LIVDIKVTGRDTSMFLLAVPPTENQEYYSTQRL